MGTVLGVCLQTGFATGFGPGLPWAGHGSGVARASKSASEPGARIVPDGVVKVNAVCHSTRVVCARVVSSRGTVTVY